MEVPYQIEDEQFIGLQSLKSTQKSFKSQHPTPKIVENSTNNFDSTYSIDSSLTMDASNNTTTTIQPFTNGENPQIIEGNLSQVPEDGTYSEYKEPIKSETVINVAQNGESNGFTNEQNGNGVIEYPILEEINGDGATTSSSSKTLETDVGLKNVETLFNESSNGLNGLPSYIYNTETILNKTLILNGQSEITEASGSQEVEIGVDEYDVEKVIHNQESHDLFCPHCKRDITKRVILKRRKRNIGQVYGGVKEKPGLTSITPEDQDTKKSKVEEEPSHGQSSSDGCIDAISCFSCFSVFIRKGDGFLWWRFTPKPAVTLTTGDPPVVNQDPAKSPPVDQPDNAFFWILTCCQPYHTEKPVLKPGSKPPSTPEDELPPSTGPIEGSVPPAMPEHPAPVTPVKDEPHDPTYQPPTSLDPGTPSSKPLTPIKPYEDNTLPPEKQPVVTPPEEHDSPLWFLTCCQPSSEGKKQKHPEKTPGADKLHDPTYQPPTSLDPDTPSVNKPLTPIEPYEGTTLPREEQPGVTPPEENDSSLWFLTCCQPSSEGKKPKHPDENQDAPPLQGQRPSLQPPSKYAPPLKGQHPSLQSPSKLNTDLSSNTSTTTKPTSGYKPRETQPPITPAPAFPLWFVTCCQPSTDDKEPKPATNQEGTLNSSGVGTPVESEDGTKTQHHVHDQISDSGQLDGTGIQQHDTKPPSIESDTPVPPTEEPPAISESWITIPTKPLRPIKPSPDFSSPSEPVAPTTPPKGDRDHVTLHVPEELPPSSVILPDTPGTEPLPDITEPLLPSGSTRAGVGMDIIKAIVYGGLLECITSLSVITSAAGGDATTLNIVALGLANVFGGLVLLFHNLRVLKHEQATDRYVDQLGRPGHFLLHSIVAILSYLIFGLMSPLIYGFTFRKSDNKDYKLATLATASLLCVAILSIAKAYSRRAQLKVYFQTFFYYVSMAFMVSGLGFVAGDLINMLLKKYGVFDSQTEPVDMREAWASY